MCPVAAALPLANTISPSLVVVPGFGLLGLHVAFTLSILAAFVERPFVSRAGVAHYALCRSLQANFVTTIIGILCIPIAIASLALPALILVWWPVAIWMSYRVEAWWYARGRHERTALQRGPILWGNLASNGMFFLIALLTPTPSSVRLRQLHEREPWMTIVTYAACAVIYGAAFVLPYVSGRTASSLASGAPTPEPVAAATAPSRS
jgi:uncharacterized membrane protein